MSGGRPSIGGGLAFAACLPLFVVLCTLNSAGYRYGASDQAFYVPAVLERLDPSLYPRDGALIASQARLTRIDESIAAVARLTISDLPLLFGALYVLTLVLLAAAGWRLAQRFYDHAWTAAALLAALTLRHAIAKSGTNTLEAYFHPRQLAFALGALAVASFAHGGRALPPLLVLAGALLHPTTALWFAVWLAVAAAVTYPRVRLPIAAAACVAGAAGLWALTAGPLAGRLIVMDPEWLATLATKDYLFPLDWPLSVWLINLGYIPVILYVFRLRSARGLVDARERGLVAGCLALAAIFLGALPFIAAHVALAVQLQIARVFWMLDFLAVAGVVWLLAEAGGRGPRQARVVALAVAVASLARGAFVVLVRFEDRPPIQARIAADDWGQVMAFARQTPSGSGWIADPMHAVLYGTSVRVAGERDVLVEAVKDTAIGMYSRDIAMRTRERLEATGDFASLTAAGAEALASRYGMDYLVTESTLALPLAFRSGSLRVYRLRAPAASR